MDNGLATIMPSVNWSGKEVIMFTATAGHLSTSINVTIDVVPDNDPPVDLVIIAESIYSVEDTQIVKCKATDPDITYGDHLTFVWNSNTTGRIGKGRSINLSLP